MCTFHDHCLIAPSLPILCYFNCISFLHLGWCIHLKISWLKPTNVYPLIAFFFFFFLVCPELLKLRNLMIFACNSLSACIHKILDIKFVSHIIIINQLFWLTQNVIKSSHLKQKCSRKFALVLKLAPDLSHVGIISLKYVALSCNMSILILGNYHGM